MRRVEVFCRFLKKRYRVAAMILNRLGFIDDRLYMFPEFLENKPVDRFFGPQVTADQFNDDALGRCLDAISAYLLICMSLLSCCH